jgi:hypothetical protein
MASKMTHTKAFEHFGAKPANPRWSWSARCPKGVVATFWQDLFKKRDGKLVYVDSLKGNMRHGARELMRNLAHAWANFNGELKVIIAVPKDANAAQRSIKVCFPSKLIMRLVHLDLETGAFVAEVTTA